MSSVFFWPKKLAAFKNDRWNGKSSFDLWKSREIAETLEDLVALLSNEKSPGPLFLVCFFFEGDGVCTTYTHLGLSCIVAILLSEQYLPGWDREQFDSKWFLEKIWKTLRSSTKNSPKTDAADAWNKCVRLLLFHTVPTVYVNSFSFLGHVSFGVSHLRRITTERFHQKTGGQLSIRRLPSWWQISIIKVDIFPDAPTVRNIYVYSYHKF